MRSRIRVTFNSMTDDRMFDYLVMDNFNPVKIDVLKTRIGTGNQSEIDQENIEIFKAIIGKIAEDDRIAAEHGSKFLITHSKSHGIVCLESDNVWFIRFVNPSLIHVKQSTEKIVNALHSRATKNGITIKFMEDEADIFEVDHNQQIDRGKILPSRKLRIQHVRKKKKIEFYASVTCLSLFFAFLLLSCPLIGIKPSPAQPLLIWIYDICTKLIGPLTVTGIINYVNYKVFFRKVMNRTVLWSIDQV